MRARRGLVLFAMAPLLLSVAVPAHANILVVAPHPDDDLLYAAGVVQQAVVRGEPVRVVFMTNGDAAEGPAQGYLRETEAVAGQAHLLVAEDSLIFLGYPDGNLETLYNQDPGEVYRTGFGVESTYADHGLGGMDYHSYRFGSPGPYSKSTVEADLDDVIASFAPDQIFTLCEFDGHPDHSTTYFFVKEALTRAHQRNPAYLPVLLKSIVWWHDWPNAKDPTVPFAVLPDIEQTNLEWGARKSFEVLLPLQSTNLLTNPKALAIGAHASQGGADGFLGDFIHRDEIFWTETFAGTNHLPTANAAADQSVPEGASVSLDGSGCFDEDLNPISYRWYQVGGTTVALAHSASSAPSFVAPSGLSQDETLSFQLIVSDGQYSSAPDNVHVVVRAAVVQDTNIAPSAAIAASTETSAYGQLAVKAVDGVIDGYPGDYTREWATAGQGAGAWLRLTWSQPYLVDRIVLFDRPNLADNVQSATVSFSDGSSLAIGALANNGAGDEYRFGARVVTSLTLTVTEAGPITHNIGLAEIQVYGRPSGVQRSLVTSVSPQGAGTILRNPDKTTYYDGEQVELTAQPTAGYVFGVWSGAATGNQSPVTVTMNSDKTVTAAFLPNPGTLAVTPQSAFDASGSAGGPMSPPSIAYLLQNWGGVALQWSATNAQPWVSLSSTAGTLAPGATGSLTVSINGAANALPAGSYSDTVVIRNLTNGSGDTSRAVTLTIAQATAACVIGTAPAGRQIVVDGTSYTAPQTFTWVVGSSHTVAVTTPQSGGSDTTYAFSSWSDGGAASHTIAVPSAGATYTANFSTQYRMATSVASPGGGSVAPAGTNWYAAGQSVTVAATANSGYSFVGWSGDLSGSLSPVSLTMNGPKTITASFQLNGGNIAPSAAVTASSQATGTGQLATKAVDGVIDGYPGDYSREWATSSQGAGAWIQLMWSRPYLVDRVLLYDRPNPDDNVQSGTLSFSDGSTVAVGALSNGGAGVEYRFTPRVISSLRLTIDSVSAATRNVGLAEFQVFGSTDVTQFALTTAAAPLDGGSVTRNPDKTSYFAGEQVTLTAQPNAGYTFIAWSGDTTGTQNPLSVVMDGNRAITATFAAVPGSLSVTPLTGFSATGQAGGPFIPASQIYTLQNTGGTSVAWSAAKTQGWVALSVAAGTLAPGASVAVTVSVNSQANALGVGAYSDSVIFTNLTNGGGTTSRSVALAVTLPTVTCIVTSSPAGRQVIVDGTSYTAPQSLSWVVGSSHTIAVASPQDGATGIRYAFASWSDGGSQTHVVAAPAASATYTAQFTTRYSLTTSASPSDGGSVSPAGTTWYDSGQVAALAAAAGTGYTFANWSGDLSGTASPASVTMSGARVVTAVFQTNGANVAAAATATASTQASGYGQLATKAVDGVVDGYPGDYAREWATTGQGVGAWLQLTWSRPYLVDRIVLFDRPNLNDNITDATLSFSDGSTVAVGALTNSGAGVELTFTARTVISVRLSVTGVGGGTQSIGLSEIQVYGVPQ